MIGSRVTPLVIAVSLVGFPLLAAATPAEIGPPGNTVLTFNPLGVLQFGPILDLGFRITPSSYVSGHLRWATVGLLYYALSSDGFEDDVHLDNIAFGVGFQQLLGDDMQPHRWYLGPKLEYGWGSTSGEESSFDWQGHHTYVTFLGNVGHRWRFSGVDVNVGLLFGAAQHLTDTWWKLSDPDAKTELELETVPVGMIELSFSWEL
jgi:hypothetical protein